LRVGRGGVLLAIVWSAWTRVLRSCRDCEWAARAVEEVGGGATAGGEDWLSAGCSRRRLRESTREEGFHLGCRVWVSARHLHQRGLWVRVYMARTGQARGTKTEKERQDETTCSNRNNNFQQLFLPVGVGRSRESSIAQTILAYEHAYSLVIVL